MFPPNTRVLVVDDMKTMRMVVKKVLSGLGFTNIVEADDGETGWQVIERSITEMNPIKLIVSDWTMPKMTGLDLLKKVRAHPEMGKTPFVLVTAEADAAIVKEAIAAGVSNYVTKPFTPDTLKEKLNAVYEKTHK